MKNNMAIYILIWLYSFDNNHPVLGNIAMGLVVLDAVIIVIGLIKIALGKPIES